MTAVRFGVESKADGVTAEVRESDAQVVVGRGEVGGEADGLAVLQDRLLENRARIFPFHHQFVVAEQKGATEGVAGFRRSRISGDGTAEKGCRQQTVSHLPVRQTRLNQSGKVVGRECESSLCGGESVRVFGGPGIAFVLALKRSPRPRRGECDPCGHPVRIGDERLFA